MRLTATHKMGIAALIMAGSVFLSRLMGLVRDKVVSWQFGAGAESDVYFAAFFRGPRLPQLPARGRLYLDHADPFAFQAVRGGRGRRLAVLLGCVLVGGPRHSRPDRRGMDLRSGTRPDRRAGIFPGRTGPAGPFPAHHPARTGLLPARRVRVRPALYSQAIPGPRAHTAHLQRLHHRGRPPRDRAGHGRLLLGRPVRRGPRLFLLPVVAARSSGSPLPEGVPAGLRLPLQPAPPATWARGFSCWPCRSCSACTQLWLWMEQIRAYFRLYGGRGGGTPPELCPAHHACCPWGVVAQAAGVASFPFLAALAAPGRRRRIRRDPLRRTALRGSMLVVVPAARPI